MRRLGQVVVAIVIAGLGCGRGKKEPPAELPPPPAVVAEAIEPAGDRLVTDEQVAAFARAHVSDAWYSVYLQDRKAGWANLAMRPAAAGEPGGYAVTFRMRIELSGPEGTSRFEVTDQTFYGAAPPFAIVEKRLREDTESGVAERTYRATADGLELVATTDGKAAPPRRLPATRETLASTIMTAAMPPTATAGQRASFPTFDDERGVDQRDTVTIEQVTTETLAGVQVPVVTVAILEDGETLPVKVRIAGGMALAITFGSGLRLELADRADAEGPVERISMMDTSVPVDRKLGDTTRLDELTLVVGAAAGFEFPTGPHQQVTRTDDGRHRITLRSVPGPAVTAAERARALVATSSFDIENPQVRALAAKVVDGADTDRARVDRIVRWVYKNLEKDLATNLSTASQVLDRRRGDCTEHTLLLVALARAAGIPAREVGGLMYADEMQRFFWHAWAQVELDGHWVAVDGAWGQSIADVGHLTFDIDQGSGSATMGSLTIEAPL